MKRLGGVRRSASVGIATLAAVATIGGVGLIAPISQSAGAATTPTTRTLLTDTFTGRNGSKWGKNWSYTNVSHGSATIQSNGGRMSVDGTPGAFVVAADSGGAWSVDPDGMEPERVGAKFSYQWSSNAPGGYLEVGFGLGYNFYAGPWNVTEAGLKILSDHSSPQLTTDGTSRVTGASLGRTSTAKWWGRIEWNAGKLRAHVWRNGTAEPTTWTTDSNGGTVRHPFNFVAALNVGKNSVGPRSVTIDNLSVYRF